MKSKIKEIFNEDFQGLKIQEKFMIHTSRQAINRKILKICYMVSIWLEEKILLHYKRLLKIYILALRQYSL